MTADQILQTLIFVMPIVADLFNREVGVAVTDREKYLLYRPSRTLDLGIPSGAALKPGTAVMRAIQEGRRVVVRGDKNTFGLPYIATAYPVRDSQQQVVGAAVIIQTTALQDSLKDTAIKLNEIVSNLASSSQEVSAQTEEIAAVTGEVAKTAQVLERRAKDTDQALSLIRNIAGQTNLLGLNAAIEAARVGDQGRGFGVVADEIRKLATISAESVKSIAEISRAIQTDSEETYRQLRQVTEAVAQISQAITHIAATIQETAPLVRRIDEMAEKLTEN